MPRKIVALALWLLMWWGQIAAMPFMLKSKEPEPEPEEELSPEQKFQIEETTRCYKSPAYFIRNYVKILDGTSGQWIPFDLWDEQETTLNTIRWNQLVVILKARQIGLSWLVLGYALWLMIFKPIATVLIFSKRDDEAVYLLGDDRLKGMFKRLPDFLKVDLYAIEDSGHTWKLSSGSIARAFPATGGDSYTATLAIIDEADLVPDLPKMIGATKPTIEAGGQMVMLSRSNKDEPNSEFKTTYKGAKKGQSGWVPVFLPWYVRPTRKEDAGWYERVKAEIWARTGSYDELWEQYPATDREALAGRTLSKRIPLHWLEQVYVEMPPLDLKKVRGVPTVPDLKVFVLPIKGRRYVIGIDTAEGNVQSDDSAISVFDQFGEEVALAYGKWEPDTTAYYAWLLAKWYNYASLMPERNNHGHALLLWLKLQAPRANVLFGHDAPRDRRGNPIKPDRKQKRADTVRYGWLSNKVGKQTMYTEMAQACRDKQVTIHSTEVQEQLQNIESKTLRAPEGEFDDIADAATLALVGIPQIPARSGRGVDAGRATKGWGFANDD